MTLPCTVWLSRRGLAFTLASVVCMTLVPILSVSRLAAAAATAGAAADGRAAGDTGVARAI